MLSVAEPTGPRGPQRLRTDAAASWQRMLLAGMPKGCLRSGYRTWAEQEAEVERMRLGLTPSALPPGTSVHGEGMAADADEPARSWLWAHGAEYGWVTGRVKSERWHVEYEPTRDQHIGEPTTPVVVTPPPPPVPEEDVMASLDDVKKAVAAAVAPLAAQVSALTQAAARSERVWRKFPGSNLAWIDLGGARRAGTREEYEADGKPPIGSVPLGSPFWRLPIVGGPGQEMYRLPLAQDKSGACWLLDVQDGHLVRYWPGEGQRLTDTIGTPAPIVDLDKGHDFWKVPAVGTLPQR